MSAVSAVIRRMTLGITLLMLCIPVSALAQDEDPKQVFNEFRQIVSGFDRDDQIASWEAFIIKYPDSPYVSVARQIISDLKAGRSTSASSAGALSSSSSASSRGRNDGAGNPDAGDLDLDFVEGSTDRAGEAFGNEPSGGSSTSDASFFDDSGFEQPSGSSSSSASSSDPSNQFFDDVPPSPAGRPDEKAKVERPADPDQRLGRRARRRVTSGQSWGETTRSLNARPFVIEVAPFVAMSPDEVYVRNTIVGANAGVHLGKRFFAEAELAGAFASETPLLQQLRDIDGQPEVLMGYRFMAGAGAGYKLFSGPNNFPNGGHDVFARLGGGLVLSNVEVCYENTDGVKCAEPQIVSGWFPYGNVGLGYRYYFNPNLGLRADVRYRGLLEIVDGVVRPRGNFQLNLGASFAF